MDSFYSLKLKYDEISTTNKIILLKLTFVFPNTTSIVKDIEISKKHNITIELDFSKDIFTQLLPELIKNPKIMQMGSKDLLIDIFQTISQNQKEFEFSSLDYILIQRTKMPVLCLKNRILDGYDVSAFLELNDLRTNLYYRYDLPKQKKIIWMILQKEVLLSQ